MNELKVICDKCGGTEWEIPDPVRHWTLVSVFGESVLVCHKCGAIRYLSELDVRCLKSD